MTTTEIATSSIDIFSDEVLQDPYPHYAELRELGPLPGDVQLPAVRAHQGAVLQLVGAHGDAVGAQGGPVLDGGLLDVGGRHRALGVGLPILTGPAGAPPATRGARAPAPDGPGHARSRP